MNPPKCDEMDYINFLIAAQRVFSSVDASQGEGWVIIQADESSLYREGALIGSLGRVSIGTIIAVVGYQPRLGNAATFLGTSFGIFNIWECLKNA
jgi:hypothetical protein